MTADALKNQNESEITVNGEPLTDENSFQIVSFELGNEEFGIDIFAVKEIIRMVPMTRVPNAPSFVIGVINMRGKVIPIIDLCKRFGLPPRENSSNSDKIIVVIEHETKTVGFLVDGVKEVIRINHSLTEPPPPMVSGIDSEYITSIGKLDDRLLILLDIARILVLKEEVLD